MTESGIKLKAAILVVSETASKDASTDKCIPILKDVFSNVGDGQWEVTETVIVPDDVLTIQKTIRGWADCHEPVNLVVTSGGTGFATKDVTPEVRGRQFETCNKTDNRKAVTHLLERQAPGLV
jgi:gephyrin